MKRVRFGFRSPLSLLGRTIFPNAGVWVIRIPARNADELAGWLTEGKAKAAAIGNAPLQAFFDRLFIEVE